MKLDLIKQVSLAISGPIIVGIIILTIYQSFSMFQVNSEFQDQLKQIFKTQDLQQLTTQSKSIQLIMELQMRQSIIQLTMLQSLMQEFATGTISHLNQFNYAQYMIPESKLIKLENDLNSVKFRNRYAVWF